jgi:hypothetical protein
VKHLLNKLFTLCLLINAFAEKKRLVKDLLNKNSNYVSIFGDLFWFIYLNFVLLLVALADGSGLSLSGPLRGPASKVPVKNDGQF